MRKACQNNELIGGSKRRRRSKISAVKINKFFEIKNER